MGAFSTTRLLGGAHGQDGHVALSGLELGLQVHGLLGIYLRGEPGNCDLAFFPASTILSSTGLLRISVSTKSKTRMVFPGPGRSQQCS